MRLLPVSCLFLRGAFFLLSSWTRVHFRPASGDKNAYKYSSILPCPTHSPPFEICNPSQHLSYLTLRTPAMKSKFLLLVAAAFAELIQATQGGEPSLSSTHQLHLLKRRAFEAEKLLQRRTNIKLKLVRRTGNGEGAAVDLPVHGPSYVVGNDENSPGSTTQPPKHARKVPH
ncbi:hypothetical protein O181_003974 [Austropuccinia psidii MF-1]|uniref:Uncharacterized protein n=1 Tax=Austropuccinia psidii MF-1 TaxID=1389203 RepID=A0A9Q3GED3_9BASI|nr:hypothetical protein [Austropuccinia psidii MF-1]